MKKIFSMIGVLAAIASFAQSSNNPLLSSSFWQTKPSLNTIQSEIAKGSSPTEMNAYAFDPVVMAINAEASNEAIIYLIEQGDNQVNKLTHDSRTYIFWAAYKGNVVIMKHLLAKGAKTDLIDSHGASPLTFAAGAGEKNTEVYDLLLARGANLKKDLNHDGANALLLAIGSDDDLTLTTYFQSKGLDLKSTDADGNTAFNYVAKAGSIELMKKLLAKGVKFTNEAMVMAAMGSRRKSNGIEVFQYLESIGINPAAVDHEGNNALHYIVRRPNKEELITYFLNKGTDVNQTNHAGNTVFMNAAAANNNLATIKLLMPTVKNINTQNKDGATALALAVNNNTAAVVKYLIEQGADVNISDTKGNNMAYYLINSYRSASDNSRQPTAPQDDFEQKLKTLQEKGLNLAAPQNDGNTLYHLAIAKNDLQLLKRIASLGADINAVNKEGFTVLHKAALTSKNDEILRYLLSAGANKDIETAFGETAYELAAENEFLSNKKISVEFLK